MIVTDRDRIFTSNLWQQLFKSLGVKLHFSTSYHPQTDGQTERVNQCLETYLRCMAFDQPTKWHNWLSIAEWWYNTTFHTSLQMTPFQALYGFKPPMIAESALRDTITDDTATLLRDRQLATTVIKENLTKAQERMKHFADKKRTDRELAVGDMVYLKIQLYRHTSLSIHRHLKLHSKYYGPFRVLERVCATSYKLLLPDGCQLHPTFHVSQLKKHIGPDAVPSPHLPLDEDGVICIVPEAIPERKLIPRVQGDISIPVVQWKVKWLNQPEEAASWEDSSFIQKVFPDFQPWGQVYSQAGGLVRTAFSSSSLQRQWSVKMLFDKSNGCILSYRFAKEIIPACRFLPFCLAYFFHCLDCNDKRSSGWTTRTISFVIGLNPSRLCWGSALSSMQANRS